MGCDAMITYGFDQLRKALPFICQLTKLNRLYYALVFIYYYLKSLLFKEKNNLFEDSLLFVNKREIAMRSSGNLLFLNIRSRMGGLTDEWHKARVDGKPFRSQQISDGKFELMFIDSYKNLALSTLRLLLPRRMAQGQTAMFFRQGSSLVPFHYDGEAFLLRGSFLFEITRHT